MTELVKPRYGRTKAPSLWEDIKFTARMVALKRNIQKKSDPKAGYNTMRMWVDRVDATPHSVGLVWNDTEYTYADMERESNKFSQVLKSKFSVTNGEVVGIMMDNRPEFLFLWLGIVKLGGVVALINPATRGRPLQSSLELSKARTVVAGSEMCASTAFKLSDLAGDGSITWCSLGGFVEGMEDITAEVTSAQGSVRPDAWKQTGPHDILMYIYTSGTTGLPKAAKIKHSRFFGASLGHTAVWELTPEDRVYGCLPLYHSSALMIGVGSCWGAGCTFVLRPKFSASKFFAECKASRATVIQYIGEICRFLTLKAPNDGDRDHNIRMAIGNGLRPDVWQEFADRFGVEHFIEFYGSTEGTTSMFQGYDKIGAVGYIPNVLRLVYPIKLVKFDYDTGEPFRNEAGRCVVAVNDEAGEAISEIVVKDPFRRFDGYSDKAATEKKILRNVFKEGDQYFRSGDLLMHDSMGFWYFCDRVGDTFRWKGENVATTEVEEVMNSAGVIDGPCNVYGVSLPKHDGRAGMAAISIGDSSTVTAKLETLSAACKKDLAKYQIPVFVRLVEEMEVTGTSKLKKQDLMKEGADPSTVGDPLYYWDAKSCKYAPLDKALYDKIVDPATQMV